MTTLKKTLLAAAMAGLTVALAGPSLAAENPAARSEPIYGYQLMTPAERDGYRERMRSARSVEERQAIRDEHHAAMVERAKERGVTLPEQPTGAGAPGAGRGPGSGPHGPGMGPGTRMGPPEGHGPGTGPRGPGYGPGSGPQR